MKRKIIDIDEEKCNGCGACAIACHEGAIEMVNGKAKLIKDDFCDGFGDCLPKCPTGAITFGEREAAAYDEKAVEARKKQLAKKGAGCAHVGFTCPSVMAKKLERANATDNVPTEKLESCLAQWPCQIKLAPVNAPFFKNADLLIAADCTAYAYANIHAEFMRGKVTLIGCPKLDNADYSQKLGEILTENDIKSLTVLRMEVPCCGGIERAAYAAIEKSRKNLPISVITISINGNILSRK